MLDLNILIGLSENVAIEKIRRAGLKSRITEKDGQLYICTRDLRSDRVNLIIKDGKVISSNIG